MLFWIVCALLTTLAVMVVVRPMLRAGGPDAGSAAADILVYRDQLSEIDRDLERGLIQPAEAEAARIEISRRLLHADAQRDGAALETSTAGTARTNPIPVYVSAAFIVVASLAAYLLLGSPGLPGTNHAERSRQDPRKASITEQIARVEARLREMPDDAAGWDVIAPVYLKLRRYADAAKAFSRAMELKGPNARRLAGFAEASLARSNGRVTPEIRNAYAQLLKLRPGDPTARFWLSMAHEQAGEKAQAAAGYKSLLAAARGNPRFEQLLRERLAAVGAAEKPEASSAPDTEAGRSIAALPPKERLEAIRGMVAGLAEKLARDGNDVAGWKRLIQAYVVLGERDKAGRAYADGRKALAGNAAALQEIEALARSLGLGT